MVGGGLASALAALVILTAPQERWWVAAGTGFVLSTAVAVLPRGEADKVLAGLLAKADAAGKIDWTVSVDATINRAHQHGTNTTRPEQDTGGSLELHETAR